METKLWKHQQKLKLKRIKTFQFLLLSSKAIFKHISVGLFFSLVDRFVLKIRFSALFLGNMLRTNYSILNFLLIQVNLRSGTLIGLLLWFLQFFNSNMLRARKCRFCNML